MVWITPWPGSVGGVGLAREDELHRAVRVGDEAGDALGVAEEQGRALVGRHAPGEADGQHLRVEDVIQLREHAGRFAQTGQLPAQADGGVFPQRRLLQQVRIPQGGVIDLVHPCPETVLLLLGVEMVEVTTKAA